MKKIILSLFILGSVLAGCTKTDTIQETAPKSKTTETKAIDFSRNTLEFGSQDEINSAILELALMSEAEKEAWHASKPGFVSQTQAADMVAAQFAQATDLSQANAIRDLYDDIFIFNTNVAANDYMAYLKADKIGHSWVCSAYGEVKIAGNIVNLNDISTYEQTWQYETEKVCSNISTRAKPKEGVEERLNYLHSYTETRKMWARVEVVSRTIFVRLSAQQKIWFAWHGYSNSYTIRKGTSHTQGLILSTLMNKILNQNYICHTGDISSNTGFSIGEIRGTAITSLRIYSNGVGVKNEGQLNIQVQ